MQSGISRTSSPHEQCIASNVSAQSIKPSSAQNAAVKRAKRTAPSRSDLISPNPTLKRLSTCVTPHLIHQYVSPTSLSFLGSFLALAGGPISPVPLLCLLPPPLPPTPCPLCLLGMPDGVGMPLNPFSSVARLFVLMLNCVGVAKPSGSSSPLPRDVGRPTELDTELE